MFRKLQGSRYGMLTGAAGLALIVATVLVAGSGPAPAAIALGVVATVVGVAAISFLIAWIVRTNTELSERRSRPARERDPWGRPPGPPHGRDRWGRGPRPPHGRDPRA